MWYFTTKNTKINTKQVEVVRNPSGHVVVKYRPFYHLCQVSVHCSWPLRLFFFNSNVHDTSISFVQCQNRFKPLQWRILLLVNDDLYASLWDKTIYLVFTSDWEACKPLVLLELPARYLTGSEAEVLADMTSAVLPCLSRYIWCWCWFCKPLWLSIRLIWNKEFIARCILSTSQ